MSPSRTAANQRLSIWHLLVWSAGSAVFLATLRATVPTTMERVTSGYLVLLITHSVYAGFCLTGLWHAALGIRHRSRTVIEPGTWALCCLSWFVLILMASLWGDQLDGLPSLTALGATAAMALGWTAPLLSRRLAWRWKLLFFPMIATCLMRLLIDAELVVSGWPTTSLTLYQQHVQIARAAFVILFSAGLAWFDHRRKIRYSVFHWGGLVCLGMHTVIPAVWWIIW